MKTVNYSNFRSQLASFIDRVNEDHQPFLVTRQNASPCVVMSLEDFQSYEETAYLMSSPKNAERLGQAIAQVKTGKAQQRKLIEE